MKRAHSFLLGVAIVVLLFLPLGCSEGGNPLNAVIGKAIRFIGRETPAPRNLPKITSAKVTHRQANPLGIPDSIREKVEEPFQIEIFEYKPGGMRDPFRPLITPERGKQPEESGLTQKLLDPDNVTLVGIVRGEDGYIAMVDDASGEGYVLREGDKVVDGVVEKVGADYVVFRITRYGVVTRKKLSLKEE